MMNFNSPEESILRHKDFKVSDRSVDFAGFRNSSTAASFWSLRRATAAASRSGIEYSRWLRDWRVSVEVDSKERNFESRDSDLRERDSWREVKWEDRVLNN